MPDGIVLRSALLILSAIALACDDPSSGQGADCATHRVRMGVASSLREVAERLPSDLASREAPIAIDLIFGASSVLARQIALGAPMDVFVSADAEIVDDLIRRDLIRSDSTREIARGRLDLLARADWPGRSDGLDTIDPGEVSRIAIPGAAVPLGRYARGWLSGRGWLERFQGRIVTTEDARATLSAVDAGRVDLAVVYDSDARLARRAVLVSHIDPREHPPIRYVAGRVATAPPCDAIDAALAAWSEPTLQQHLRRLGFLSPEPGPAEVTP